jgi:hypothetical protein
MLLSFRKNLSKWLNLFCFVLIDFTIVALVLLMTIQNEPNNPDSLFGFVLRTNFDPLTDWFVVPAIWGISIVLRFLILYIYIKRSFRSTNITCLYDSENPYEIPMSTQVSLFSLGVPIEEIHQMILQYVKIHNFKIDKVYVNISGIPNISVYSLHKKYVVLNSNILRLLSKPEIEALFVQEVFYMKTSNSTLRTIFTSPRLFLQFVYWYVYLRIIFAASRFVDINNIFNTDIFRLALAGIFLVVVYFTFRFIELISLSFLHRSNHAAEYLADIKMVELAGKQASMSMLTKVGLRLSTIYTFYDEIQWLIRLEKKPLLTRSILQRELNLSKTAFVENILDYFPVDLMNPSIAVEKAPLVYLKWRTRQLSRYYNLRINKQELKESIKKATKELIDKRKKQISKIKYEKNLPFFAARENAFRENKIVFPEAELGKQLSIDDIQNIILFLKKYHELPFFEEEFTPGGPHNHPTIRKRLLFIQKLKI